MQLSKPNTLFIFLLILLLGLGLRLYRLDYQSLWTDEILTYGSSNGSLNYVINQTKINTNILPLYYVFVNTALRFGDQDITLRLPSLIFGILSIFLFYVIISNWLGSKIALISTFLMAISPFHIWYSQEARPYALLILLSLLSIWFLQKIINNQADIKSKIGFIIFSAATFYCHTVAIAFIGVLAIYLLLTVPCEKRKHWLFIFAGVILLILPGLYRLIIFKPLNSGDPNQSFSLLFIPYTIWTFASGFSLGPSISELHMPDRSKYVIENLAIIIPIMLTISALFFFGIFKLWKENKSVFLFNILLFIFPLALATLGAILTPHPFSVRYTALSFLPFILFIAIGIKNLKGHLTSRGALILIFLLSMFSIYNYFHNERYHKEDNRAAGQFLAAHAIPNDLVICSAAYTHNTLIHYYKSNYIKIMGYPTETSYVKADGLESDLNKIIAGRNRFWLFLSRTFHSDPEGYLRKYCDEKFRRALELKRSGVELVLYTNILNNKS
jgi:uncharacterized membrane protein